MLDFVLIKNSIERKITIPAQLFWHQKEVVDNNCGSFAFMGTGAAAQIYS